MVGVASGLVRLHMKDVFTTDESFTCMSRNWLTIQGQQAPRCRSIRNTWLIIQQERVKCFNERSVERATVLYLFLCFVFSFSRESSGPSSYLSLIKLLRPARTVLPSHKSARLISQREVLASSTNKTPIQGGYDNSVWSNFGFCSCCLSIFH